ncbi:hypothetical protein Csp2054_08195 [Curtobacterium sp. 'Ferrero']|uniref:hypothetical protein n=1 Tax=Curtobacterium sp. 'Ferrero' TaxID=2033654 RepID=UPI000BC7786C|nr:hypothetical protein [Curtobacterium sp. 'Ferrero']PCN48129.1 hypothetical protein Csp2054_08195 [Curtobacterium sp. 'Ferrero']
MTSRARTTKTADRSTASAVHASTGRSAVRPGTFNLAGELFTPAAARLALVDSDISGERAAALVRDGAEVAFEACGCGGGGPCRPVWPEVAVVSFAAKASPPRISPRPSAPTWIDVWAGDGTTVVFCHGDVTWGSVFG